MRGKALASTAPAHGGRGEFPGHGSAIPRARHRALVAESAAVGRSQLRGQVGGVALLVAHVFAVKVQLLLSK